MQQPHNTAPVVAVIGSGVWGAAFGGAIVSNASLIFWDKDNTAAQHAANAAGNSARAEADLSTAINAADLIILSVSSAAFSLVLKQIININAAPPPIVWLTKGFDMGTQLPLCETAKTLLGNNARYGALSGPSFASEVRQQLPTALALAVSHKEDFEWMQQCFHRPYLRIYYEADMVGLCVGGAVKNIIAIAAGVADGLALGNNARAALITRGLAEMASINRALGGGNESLQGLVGMGDLLLTCCSDLSRNRRLGLAIAEQKDEALSPARRESLLAAATSEGAAALSPVLACANKHGLPVPIIRAVNAVLNESLSPAAAVEQLLSRPPAAPQ